MLLMSVHTHGNVKRTLGVLCQNGYRYDIILLKKRSIWYDKMTIFTFFAQHEGCNNFYWY